MTSITPYIADKESAAARASLSVTLLERLVRQDKFPKPRQLTERRVGWIVREIDEWCESRPVSDLLPPENTGVRKSQ